MEVSQVVISELLFRDCHELEALLQELLLCGVTESVRWWHKSHYSSSASSRAVV